MNRFTLPTLSPPENSKHSSTYPHILQEVLSYHSNFKGTTLASYHIQRIIFKLLLIVYKCTKNVAPSYLTDLLSKYLPTRTLRSGYMQLLKERKSNRTWGDRSFAIAAPHLWNELPLNIRTAKSIAVFKKNF